MTPPRPPARADADPWAPLRGLTDARIGLARSGASLATRPLLDFRIAHAQARDAVHTALDADRLADALGSLGVPVLTVSSAAADRRTYLMRPDLGRALADDAMARLVPHAGDHDLALVVSDGLSARAAQDHAAPLLAAAVPALRAAGWRLAPIVVVRLGRVAIGDRVAAALGARAVAILLGERPGLSAPDSLGAYLTWRPGPDTTDAERNCLSNIRPVGLPPADAAVRMVRLLSAMRARGLSGVALKDDAPDAALPG